MVDGRGKDGHDDHHQSHINGGNVDDSCINDGIAGDNGG